MITAEQRDRFEKRKKMINKYFTTYMNFPRNIKISKNMYKIIIDILYEKIETGNKIFKDKSLGLFLEKVLNYLLEKTSNDKLNEDLIICTKLNMRYCLTMLERFMNESIYFSLKFKEDFSSKDSNVINHYVTESHFTFKKSLFSEKIRNIDNIRIDYVCNFLRQLLSNAHDKKTELKILSIKLKTFIHVFELVLSGNIIDFFEKEKKEIEFHSDFLDKHLEYLNTKNFYSEFDSYNEEIGLYNLFLILNYKRNSEKKIEILKELMEDKNLEKYSKKKKLPKKEETVRLKKIPKDIKALTREDFFSKISSDDKISPHTKKITKEIDFLINFLHEEGMMLKNNSLYDIALVYREIFEDNDKITPKSRGTKKIKKDIINQKEISEDELFFIKNKINRYWFIDKYSIQNYKIYIKLQIKLQKILICYLTSNDINVASENIHECTNIILRDFQEYFKEDKYSYSLNSPDFKGEKNWKENIGDFYPGIRNRK